ncbi:MAG: His-Xaa-Ser system protein HxsD [Candidatus Aenigmarchaeota archaeon]|nr:His-Xaa-Ser system protein HxsD [Candidatus Aenigmarchaeota archaeon]
MKVPKVIEVQPKENQIIISINPKIYPLEVIYSAAYMFLDKAYIIIDGNPETEIIVTMKAKKGMNRSELEKIGLNFHNELINYSVYVVQAARNNDIRKAIVERALGTNLEVKETSDDEDIDFIEDPEGIAEQWTPEKAEGLDLPEELKEDFEDDEKK